MKTVWKFKVTDTHSIISIPKDAEILEAKLQGEDICIWAIVNDENEKVNRRVNVIGTGWEVVGDFGKYISTVQIPSSMGELVFHVFDAGEI